MRGWGKRAGKARQALGGEEGGLARWLEKEPLRKAAAGGAPEENERPPSAGETRQPRQRAVSPLWQEGSREVWWGGAAFAARAESATEEASAAALLGAGQRFLAFPAFGPLRRELGAGG